MPESDLILLALDEPQLLQLLERALQAASYRVAKAHDRDALDKALQETTPALLVVSERFKGSQGVEIAAALLERFPTLPVLIFAEKESLALVRESLRIGVVNCLIPPLHIEEIMRAVEEGLKRARRVGDWNRREVRRTTASLEKRVDELQRLETVFAHIDDGVMILDTEKRIILINPAMRRAFALDQQPLAGKPVQEVIQNPDLRRLVGTGGSGPTPYHEIAFDDARVFSAQYTAIPSIGAAITMQDITHLKTIDRLKSEFVHTVSHDLRSPLTAILGYVELLDRVGPVNEQQREFIRRVQLSVQNITALVNDLLDLGRIEAGFDTQKEVIPLEGILRYAMDGLNRQLTEKKQNIRLDLPRTAPLLYGHPVRLRQLLDNLIGNAIKYTPESGEIRVKVETEGEQVILNITDTGPGIPPTDQPHIFEKFYRASNVPQDVSGSGLGLAIVKSIVDGHGGRIWVESALGKGSTFTVVLPRYKQ